MRKIVYIGTLTMFLLSVTLGINSCKKSEIKEYQKIDFSALDIGELHNKYIIEAYKKPELISMVRNKDIKTYLYAEPQQELISAFEDIPYDPTPIGMTHDEFMTKL